MRRYFPHILMALLLLLCAWLWLKNWSAESAANQVGQTIVASPAKEVRKTPKIDVKVQVPVKVYKGGAALKDGLKLPRVAIEDASVEVIASSRIDGRDDHPKTITTTINTLTGESETYVRTDSLPWVAMSSRGEVGMYAGIKNGEPAIRVQAEQELFRIKAVSFGGVASLDQPLNGGAQGDWFIGVGGELHW